ncbi:MAG TPA: HAMP domain-containing sensor histidine kinase, partial [Myxococcota bacterium]|nr:HAMP domain-containing sensor histidine kinase [Myxococcota bacterium]
VWHSRTGRHDLIASARFLHAMHGHEAVVLCPFLDVTQLRKTESSLRHTNDCLRAESALRDRLVSAITHDLRAPVSTALLNASALLRQHRDAPVVARRAARILKSMGRAEDMIRDLLDANRLKAGERLPLRRGVVRLDTLLQECVAGMQDMHGPRITLKNRAGQVTGVWDAQALGRVVSNLVSNAVKYGEADAPVEVELGVGDGVATLSVHNRGEPIPDGDRRALFDPFFRSASAIRSGQTGWGIGLALVKEIIEGHAGSIVCRSSAPEGTSFDIVLPLASNGAYAF